VTGVTATATGANPANLAAINTALNSLLVDGTKTDSVEKVQAIVNDYTAILRSADGGVATTTTPLTTAQYTRIGVADAATGAALGLLDNVIDGKANTAVDERNEVQKLSDAAKAVMTGAAGGAGPSQEQLELLGVTGVTPANLAAVQKAIADTLDDGSEVDLLSELKTVSSRGFTTAADALTQISIAARDDSANATTPSAATYALAGITGVSATASGTTLANLAAINSALNSGLIDGTKAGTVAGVQAIVNAYNLILRSADGQANNTTTALTGNQYADVGITGYSGTNTPPAEGSALHLLDNVVDLSNASAVNLYANLQLIATAAQHVMNGVAGGTAPDLNDLIRLGVTGVDNNTLATAQLAISRATNTDVDTLSELQRVIDGVLSNPTLSTLLNGVTNLEVDSKLVFSADQTVTVGTGNITITDLGGTTESGGTGYRGDTQTNTQVISMTNAVADGLVKIVGSGTGTKIIINPKWDLDLSSNYRISMDDGAFRDASGTHNMTGFTPVTFSTVKPGTHASGGTAASEAKASQYMTDGGILAAGKSWLDIEGIGDNTGTMQQLGDLSGGSYSLVMKNYATEIGKPSPDGGGSSGLDMHDTFVGVQNFGENDYLYFDAQLNDPTQQLFLPRFVGVSASGPTDSPKGLLGQTAVSLGVVATPEQVGNQAVIGLGFEGNTANKYYNSIGIVDGINGFATEWHKDSAPLIMG
jgi:hypothetical protein